MALPASARRSVQLFGTGTAGQTNEDLQWRPTGLSLDAERPRAMLIEDVRFILPQAGIVTTNIASQIVMSLAASTGRVARTATAPRNRLFIAGARLTLAHDSVSQGHGAGALLAAGDETTATDGTLWVAPWIGLVQTTPGDIAAIGSTIVRLTYRIVDIDFDLAHALWDQVDECEDVQDEWWNV